MTPTPTEIILLLAMTVYAIYRQTRDDGGFGEILVMIAVMVAFQADDRLVVLAEALRHSARRLPPPSTTTARDAATRPWAIPWTSIHPTHGAADPEVPLGKPMVVKIDAPQSAASKIDASQTRGAYSLIEYSHAPGAAGPPAHVHHASTRRPSTSWRGSSP